MFRRFRHSSMREGIPLMATRTFRLDIRSRKLGNSERSVKPMQGAMHSILLSSVRHFLVRRKFQAHRILAATRTRRQAGCDRRRRKGRHSSGYRTLDN